MKNVVSFEEVKMENEKHLLQIASDVSRFAEFRGIKLEKSESELLMQYSIWKLSQDR